MAGFPPGRAMIDPDEALRLVVEAAGLPEAERVGLGEAGGRWLAEEVRADRDWPPFDRAMMDGFAVRTADAGKGVEVVGEVAAGEEQGIEVRPGRCVEVMTGAVCPPGTEAVVEKEAASCTGNRVRLPEGIVRGGNVAATGSECRAGTLVLVPGEEIKPLAVAVLASCGRETVAVWRRPTLAVVTTGAELVPVGQDLRPGQIRDSNGPMLAAMARRMGIDKVLLLHAEDRLQAILDALDRSAERDMTLISGGVSAGRHDLVPEALKRHGAEIVFHKVSQKPGKPLLVARVGRRLLFGLPGNPLGCHLGFARYVAAAIRRREGREPVPEPCWGMLAAGVRGLPERTFFVPARAERAGPGPIAWRLHPLAAVSSADVFTACSADGYLRIPPGNVEIPPEEVVPFTWID